MTALTDKALAELERLDRAATVGPWAHKAGVLKHYVVSENGDLHMGAQSMAPSDGRDVPAEADARLVAAMRIALPDLLREVRGLRTVEAAARAWAESVEQGFAATVRPDVARARLLRTLEAK